MKLINLYKECLPLLKEKDIPEIELRILLCEINQIESMSLFFIKDNEDIKDLHRFHKLFTRLLNGEPIQYIINKASFFGREFYVDSNCLIPRMETEEVVQFAIKKALELSNDIKELNAIDICTGSGCIAITLAKELNVHVDATDISENALSIAYKNVITFNADVELIKTDLLTELIQKKKTYNFFISNPPYISHKNEIDDRVLKFEPFIALMPQNNEEVISFYKRLLLQIISIADKQSIIILEIGYDLGPKLEQLIQIIIPNCEYTFIKDINKKDRILYIRLRN